MPSPHQSARKRILRAMLEARSFMLAEGRIDLLLHWRGGDHTRLAVPRSRTGSTPSGRTRRRPFWSAGQAAAGRRDRGDAEPAGARVRSHRRSHGAAVHRPGEMAERGS
ncbi:MAG: hypothetical protein OXH68_20625 [Gammaproteobacteria bacterium]|nr:hypothetical protein [Gammaproteobacteria bacterium]